VVGREACCIGRTALHMFLCINLYKKYIAVLHREMKHFDCMACAGDLVFWLMKLGI